MSDRNTKGSDFQTRAFISMLTAFTFVAMAVSGGVLFFTPSCRIARDADWIVWGLSKEQWLSIHLSMSLVFAFAALWHVYYNFSVIVCYLSRKTQQALQLRLEWLVALLICLALAVGAARGVRPFNVLTELRDQYKHPGAVGDGAGGGGGGFRGGRGLQSP